MDAIGDYDIVVYGGTMPGVAAATNASALLGDERSVLLVNPQPRWGGGSNVWNFRNWNHGGDSTTPQAGTFRRWYRMTGQAFDPQDLAELCQDQLRGDPNIDALGFWGISNVRKTDGELRAAEVAPLKRVDGKTKFSGESVIVSGDQFIDASESGRLTRLADIPLSIGRQDWASDTRQMAATLMVKMTDIDWQIIRQARSPNGQQTYGYTVDEISDNRVFWGGHWYVKNSASIEQFHDNHDRFRIKAINAAEAGDGEVWANTLLVYDVDGRYDARERGKILSYDGKTGPWDTDRARERSKELVGSDSFKGAVRAFPGFERASFVPDGQGNPTTQDVLFHRETVHTLDADGFALDREHVVDAGTGPESGADADHFERRIGLGYYWLTNIGYVPETPSDAAESFATENPVYIPFETLYTSYVPNVLLPGYAARISSEAWFELRLLPNLCVLGDAAGVAAAMAVERSRNPASFRPEHVSELQEILREDVGAKLEKDPSYGVVG
jgi:hypothetical protein